MKLVECWRWRFRDPVSGRICRTMYAISEEEAGKYPHAERVPGTRILREVDEIDFADTLPSIGRPVDEVPAGPAAAARVSARRWRRRG
jgi:hypothetical protein